VGERDERPLRRGRRGKRFAVVMWKRMSWAPRIDAWSTESVCTALLLLLSFFSY